MLSLSKLSLLWSFVQMVQMIACVCFESCSDIAINMSNTTTQGELDTIFQQGDHPGLSWYLCPDWISSICGRSHKDDHQSDCTIHRVHPAGVLWPPNHGYCHGTILK